MTVSEYMHEEHLMKDDFSTIQDESSYWEKAGLFVLDNWEDDVSELSEKQYNWLERIRDDMTERRIKGRLR